MSRSGDLADYAILHLLCRKGTLWKKAIHEKLKSDNCVCSEGMTLSLQSVGRRVDNLQKNGCLQAALLHNPQPGRSYVVGFGISDEGLEEMERIRKEYGIFIVQEVAKAHLSGQFGGLDNISKGILSELVESELQMDGIERDLLDRESRELAEVYAGLRLSKYIFGFEQRRIELLRYLGNKKKDS